jgi:hypothetical protein
MALKWPFKALLFHYQQDGDTGPIDIAAYKSAWIVAGWWTSSARYVTSGCNACEYCDVRSSSNVYEAVIALMM